MRWSLAIGLLAAAFVLLAQEDDQEKVVVLESGKALRGKIIEDEDEAIKLRLSSGGVVTVERDRIKEIISEKEVMERYKEKLAETDLQNADEVYSLSKWCDKYGLQKERYKLLKKVLELSPEHPRAKDELRILEGKLPKVKKAELGGITFDPESISRPKSPTPKTAKKESKGIFSKSKEHRKGIFRHRSRRRRSKESKCKPKGTKTAIKKALEWLVKHPTRVRYAPVGQVVVNALTGLALMSAGVRPGEGPAGKKLSQIAAMMMRATPGVRGQECWGLGFGGMFLCEYYKRWPSDAMRQAIQKVVERLVRAQEDTGGWGHDGSHRPNPLGYREFMMVSAPCMATLGMAKRLKIKVPGNAIAKAAEYAQNSSYAGGIGYSHMPQNRRGVTAGRTGMTIAAFACCKLTNHPLYPRMCRFLQLRLKQTPISHATPSLGWLGSALGAVQIGASVWDRYCRELMPTILEHQNPDGSFRWIKNPRENIRTEDQLGPVFCTSIYLICLTIDKGHLRFLSGKYAR